MIRDREVERGRLLRIMEDDVTLRRRILAGHGKAIALSAEAGAMPAAANDFGFREMFARPLSGLGRLGGEGEPAVRRCERVPLVPSHAAAQGQELHITLGQAALELLEDRLTKRS